MLANIPARLVLFDGYCNLCSGVVRFLLRRDSHARLSFCAMQSERGSEIMRAIGLPTDVYESFVLIEDGAVYQKSTAFFRLVRFLRFPWPLLAGMRFAPRPVRDAAYDFIARRRYRWFGRREECMAPTADQRSRFLD